MCTLVRTITTSQFSGLPREIIFPVNELNSKVQGGWYLQSEPHELLKLMRKFKSGTDWKRTFLAPREYTNLLLFVFSVYDSVFIMGMVVVGVATCMRNCARSTSCRGLGAKTTEKRWQYVPTSRFFWDRSRHWNRKEKIGKKW